eukprot:302967-Rhodomonas_salina.1
MEGEREGGLASERADRSEEERKGERERRGRESGRKREWEGERERDLVCSTSSTGINLEEPYAMSAPNIAEGAHGQPTKTDHRSSQSVVAHVEEAVGARICLALHAMSVSIIAFRARMQTGQLTCSQVPYGASSPEEAAASDALRDSVRALRRGLVGK